MKLLLVAQCALLLGIVVSAAVPRSRAGAVAVLVASLTSLWALARVGLWLFPPWWAPMAAAVGVAVVLLGRVAVDSPYPSFWPTRPLGFVGLAVSVGVTTVAGIVVVRASDAAVVPEGPIVDLAFPLPPGDYLVVNGGGWGAVNAHRESVGSSDPRFLPWRGNGWAVDLVAVHAWGLRAPGVLPPDPAVYEIFDVPVLAPCAGTVVIAVDGRPDMTVPVYDRTALAGNHVLLACGDVHVLLAHLREGSVLVEEGAIVNVGFAVGRVGNSGGTGEPHLHFHVQTPGPPGMPMGGDPLPMLVNGDFLVRGDRPTGRRGS